MQGLLDEHGARDDGRQADTPDHDRRQRVRELLEEGHAAERAGVLAGGVGEGAADEGPEEQAEVPAEGEPAEGPGLGARGAVLGDHSTDGDDGAREDAGEAAEQDHLPDGAGEAEEARGGGDAGEREDEHGLPAPAVGGAAPGEHDEHLGQREEGLD